MRENNPLSKKLSAQTSTTLTAMPEIPVLKWLHDIASGLAFIHSKGWVHRDVSPNNLLIASNGRLVLADFGLAMPLCDPQPSPRGSSSKRVTSKYLPAGTPNYAAPDDALTAKLDIFSLGMVAWELIHPGHALHEGLPGKKKITQLAQWRKSAKDAAFRPSPLKNIEKGLVAFMEACWDANPEKRPTALEAQEKLKIMISDEQWNGRETAPSNDVRYEFKIRELNWRKGATSMVDLVDYREKNRATKLAVRKRYNGLQGYRKALKTYANLKCHLSLQNKNYLLPPLISHHDASNSLFLEYWGDNMNKLLVKQELGPQHAMGFLVQVLRLAAEFGSADIDLGADVHMRNVLVDDKTQIQVKIPELGAVTQSKVRFVDFDGWEVVEHGSGGSKTINLASFVEGWRQQVKVRRRECDKWSGALEKLQGELYRNGTVFLGFVEGLIRQCT